jgi:hypothetical protein
MLTDAHKMQRMVSTVTFLEWYHKNGDEFLNPVVPVTGDETWVPYVNVEIKEQLRQWMHTFTKQTVKV